MRMSLIILPLFVVYSAFGALHNAMFSLGIAADKKAKEYRAVVPGEYCDFELVIADMPESKLIICSTRDFDAHEWDTAIPLSVTRKRESCLPFSIITPRGMFEIGRASQGIFRPAGTKYVIKFKYKIEEPAAVLKKKENSFSISKGAKDAVKKLGSFSKGSFSTVLPNQQRRNLNQDSVTTITSEPRKKKSSTLQDGMLSKSEILYSERKRSASQGTAPELQNSQQKIDITQSDMSLPQLSILHKASSSSDASMPQLEITHKASSSSDMSMPQLKAIHKASSNVSLD